MSYSFPDDGDAAQGALRCVNHPNVETYLRCAKCERPICARCRVHTPVGFRCFDCARLTVLPTYAVAGTTYARSLATGVAAAVILGALMGLFANFEFWGALLLGIGVAEAVAFGSNQKRSPGLQMIAIGCIALGFFISRVVIEMTQHNYRNPALFRDLPFALDQYTILWFALASWLAYRRLQ